MTNQERMDVVNSYQDNPFVHPLTCGNNSSHDNLVPVEKSGEVILQCPNCIYKQPLSDEFIGLLADLDKCQREAIARLKEVLA